MSELHDKMMAFIRFVANDRIELSHEKIKWQRDYYVKRARELLDEACKEEEE